MNQDYSALQQAFRGALSWGDLSQDFLCPPMQAQDPRQMNWNWMNINSASSASTIGAALMHCANFAENCPNPHLGADFENCANQFTQMAEDFKNGNIQGVMALEHSLENSIGSLSTGWFESPGRQNPWV